MTTYVLKNIAMLKVKGGDFRCNFWDISSVETVNRLNNFVFYKWILVQIKRLLK